MSKFEQFFSAGGGSSYLGVPYPKASTEYKEVGNVGQRQIALAVANYQIQGHRLPIRSYPAGHLNIGSGTPTSPLLLSKASNNAGSPTPLWTIPRVINNGYAGTGDLINLWMNPINDDIYMLLSEPNWHHTEIVKVSAASGARVTICTLAIYYYQNKSVYFVPIDPLNPDTTQWITVFLNSTILVCRIINSALNTFTDSAIMAGGAVSIPVDYVTSDKKIILGGWASGLSSTKQNVTSFFVTRGESRLYIEIPYDGNLPFVDAGLAPSTDINVGQFSGNKISVIGSSIIFSIRDQATTAKPMMGRRLFDRVDFDRWLTAICDAHNMPTGVGYF